MVVVPARPLNNMHCKRPDDVSLSNYLLKLYSSAQCSVIALVALLQEKKLLNLPKLLDVCAIYGHENEDLTRILVLFTELPCC